MADPTEQENIVDEPTLPQEPPGFYKGHKLWKLRKFNRGPERLVKSPEHMVEQAIAYFQWAEENPLTEEVVGWYQGEASTHTIEHPRAITIAGFTAFLGTSQREWLRWKQERPDLVPAMHWVEAQMFEMKFSNAAAGLLNASIIARDLGLADSVDHKSTDGSMTPKPTVIEFLAPELEAPPAELPASSESETADGN